MKNLIVEIAQFKLAAGVNDEDLSLGGVTS